MMWEAWRSPPVTMHVCMQPPAHDRDMLEGDAALKHRANEVSYRCICDAIGGLPQIAIGVKRGKQSWRLGGNMPGVYASVDSLYR